MKRVASLSQPARADGRPVAILGGDAEADLAPDGVADARALDLDDLRTHLGRQGGRERLGDDGSRREDAHAPQGAEHLGDQGIGRHLQASFSWRLRF